MSTPLPDHVCPNCRQPYQWDPQFCPHCGFNLQPIPVSKYVAGSHVADVILSLLLGIVCAGTIVGILLPLGLFFLMDKRYTAFRLGLKIALIVFAVLILGALAICGIALIGMLSTSH